VTAPFEPIVQTCPLKYAKKAYDAMMDGSARFRSVIVIPD